MKAHNRFVELTLVAAFVLGVVSSMVAQQNGVGGAGSETGAQQVAKDPNLPDLPNPPSAPILWFYYGGSAMPASVFFTGLLSSHSTANYLGFNDEGSWLLHPDNGKVYVWNLRDSTLKEKFGDVAEIPKNMLASLKNPIAGYIEWAKDLANRGRERDPNMPVQQQSPPEFPIRWLNSLDPSFPTIGFKGALASNLEGGYLGFNNEGSWIVHPSGKVYVWNLKSRSLKERYPSFDAIPLETLASLRNSDGSAETVLARKSRGKQPAAPVAAGNNPPPNKGAGIFGNDARKKLEDSLPPKAGGTTSVDGAGFTGTGASIKGGVLTFTMADGSKATYKVVRPAVMAGNPQAASSVIMGTWLALVDGSKGMIFTVMADNSVTGKEMPAAMVQMLMQGGAQR